jgi:hypothetical protein
LPPPPKDPKIRQRTNKKPSASSIEAVPVLESGLAPELPARGLEATPWHPLTVAFWTDVWGSPMARKYLQADLHGLYVLAELVDQFWTKPTPYMSAEIRAVRMPYGLTPLDRNRLDWKIEAPKPAETTAVPEVKARADFDPRKVLEMPAARGKR